MKPNKPSFEVKFRAELWAYRNAPKWARGVFNGPSIDRLINWRGGVVEKDDGGALCLLELVRGNCERAQTDVAEAMLTVVNDSRDGHREHSFKRWCTKLKAARQLKRWCTKLTETRNELATPYCQ
jgi:hypothetical protein